MVAKVARPVACDTDRRDAEHTRRVQVQPVVGVRVRIGRQSVRNSIEVAVAEERIQVSLIGYSIAVPIIGIDAAIGGLDLVRARREVAVLEEAHAHVCDKLSPASRLLDRRHAR